MPPHKTTQFASIRSLFDSEFADIVEVENDHPAPIELLLEDLHIVVHPGIIEPFEDAEGDDFEDHEVFQIVEPHLPTGAPVMTITEFLADIPDDPIPEPIQEHVAQGHMSITEFLADAGDDD